MIYSQTTNHIISVIMAMEKYWKNVEAVIRQSNVVLEVIDARIPDLTRNERIEEITKRERKPLIIVVNKCDLITEEMRDQILDDFKFKKFVLVATKTRYGIHKLKDMINELVKKRRRQKIINVGIVGYPNTGKSSLINTLSKKSKTRISSIAGFTKGIQWIAGDENLRFLDTPGVIPFSMKDEVQQALISIIDPNKLVNPDLVAMRIIDLFVKFNKRYFEDFYNIIINDEDSLEIIFKIGRKKNFLKKGSEVDDSRTAIMIIYDWQRGKLLLNRNIND